MVGKLAAIYRAYAVAQHSADWMSELFFSRTARVVALLWSGALENIFPKAKDEPSLEVLRNKLKLQRTGAAPGERRFAEKLFPNELHVIKTSQATRKVSRP